MQPTGPMAAYLFADADPARDRSARAAVEARGGVVATRDGQRLQALFQDVRDAVEAAVALQVALIDAPEGRPPRCAIHVGGSQTLALHRAAAIQAAAHPGQVLLSIAAAEAVQEGLRLGFALLDLGTVRLRDLSSERVFQLVVPGLPAQFPPPRSLDDVPNNLPEALLSFVGRAREIAEIRSLLEGERLVTLLGMGGVGKTRLALHVAAEWIEGHPDGAWLVELGPLHEGRRVLPTAAAVLGLADASDEELAQALARHVGDRELLVILDNCEHVIAGAVRTARALLEAGPRVRVLATSREPLRLTGETAYLVPGLAVPRGASARDAVAHYYSVRLFVDRARAADPAFELTTQNASAIAALCDRLDGIPLAIELAAARVRPLGLHEIALRLKERFHVLTGGDATPLPRECTLWVMVDWSHGLLSEAEGVLFRRLGVFAGGWTLESATAVCAGDGLEPGDVEPLLQRLAAHSLVVAERGGQRYRMLETVREYAVQWLLQSAEADAVRDRHLDHFVRFTTGARRALSGPQQAQWLPRFDAERDNVLLAHVHAGSRADLAGPGLRLVNAMKMYWIIRGLLHLGSRVMGEALERAGVEGDTPDRAQGLFNSGQMLYFMGRHRDARERLEASLAIARGLGDAYVGTVLQPLGMACLAGGDLDRARDCLLEALELARRGGDPASIAAALNALGMLHRVDGRPGRAASLYQEAVSLARAAGNAEVEAVGLLNLAMAHVDDRRVADARTPLQAAIRIALHMRSAPASQSALEVCAALAGIQDDSARAARFFGAAQGQAGRSGVRRDAADAMFLEPRIDRARAALGEAAFAAAFEQGRRCDPCQALREAQAWLQRTADVARA